MTRAATATDEVLRECLPGFVLAAGTTSRRWSMWLDTADWLLYRSGLSCELVRTTARSSLVLHGPKGERLECALPAGAKAPLRLEVISDGPLRRRLAPVVGIRALLPLVESRRWVRDLRVLDDEAKTVVRLLAEGLVSGTGAHSGAGAEPGPGAEAPAVAGAVAFRVRVVPVRGYAPQARRVSAALAARDLLMDDAAGGDAVVALKVAGYSPGVLPGVVDPRPGPETPAAVAVARMLKSFLDQFEANLAGTIGDVDSEFLHDLRIAVRRSRSALKLVGDVLPPGAAEQFAPELKWLGDVTTPVRDLDVHLFDLPDLAHRLVAFGSHDLDPFGAHLARQRLGEQRALVKALTSSRCKDFLREWRALLERVEAGEAGLPGGVSAGTLAAARVTRADRRVVRLGSKITRDSPPDDLHTLRKRAKELRYLLDLFAFVLDAANVKALIRELKALQDVLGAFQDSEVQRDALRATAVQMVAQQAPDKKVPVDTLLALGELATHLEEEQRLAREAFDDRFARFVRPSVRRHVHALSARPEGAL